MLTFRHELARRRILKMLLRATLVTSVLLITAHKGLSSSFVSGNILLEQCSTEKSDSTYFQNDAWCVAYVAAIADSSVCGINVNGYSWNSQNKVTAGQLQKVVKKWLEIHPELLHYAASGLVSKALQDAFPCP